MSENNKICIKADELKSLVTKIFQKLNVCENDAIITADTLVQADVRGIHSHGVIRLPIYAKRLHNQAVNAQPNIKENYLKDNIVVIDADNGLGQPVSMHATKIAINKAKEYGVALIGIKNSHHYGMASYYTNYIAKHGMIGISMSNTAALMPAIGGSEAVVGNNPISISVPTERDFIIAVDMATSEVAMGKILQAEKENKEIPNTWGKDKNGNPTTNPTDVLESGLLSPVGGPKGFGLSMIVDIFTGILLNGAFGKHVKSIYKEVDKPNRCGHFFIAIDINTFLPMQTFYQLVNEYEQQIKSSKKASGVEEIFLPGELEYLKECEQRKNGIYLAEKVVNELKEIAHLYGVTHPFDEKE